MDDVRLEGLEGLYDQIKLMAIGGMAELYRGRQVSLDRPVAIKRMRPELLQNKDLIERFRREARISANLLHQNLAHVYDYRNVNNQAYIVMEWIDGFDLSQLLKKHGALPVDVAVIVAVKILHGLSYVHAHGMIHRDLKPDNIRVAVTGEVKLMDFGIAFDPLEQSLTVPGTLIGSPHYLTPEQIMGAKMDHRVDLFSFGISLYEMLTGRKPFYETSQETVYGRIQKGEFTPPQELRPDCPAFLVHVIENCLQVNRDKRPSSAMRVASTLMEYLARNYSLAFEARVRQYLMQVGALGGDPGVIEVVEKTMSEPRTGFFTRFAQGCENFFSSIFLKTLILGAFVFVLGAGGMWIFKYNKRTDGEFLGRIKERIHAWSASDTPESPVPAPAPASPKQRRKTR